MTQIISMPRFGSVADFKSNRYADKKFHFVLKKANQAPSIKSKRGQPVMFPPSFMLKMEDNIYDIDKQKMRTIRVVLGEMSIYKDEQSPDEIASPKKVLSKEFIDGELIVDGKDNLVLKYLMLTNRNGSNPDRSEDDHKITFLLVDISQGLKVAMDAHKRLNEITNWCYTGEWDDVAAYARVLGIVTRDPDEVRYGLGDIATREPEKFILGMKNPATKRKYYILEGIDKKILVLKRSTNSIEWSNNPGQPIITAPHSMDVIDYLTDSFTTPDGEKQFNVLLNILRPGKVKESLLAATGEETKIAELSSVLNDTKAPLIKINNVSFEDLQIMVEEAVKLEVIDEKGAWLKHDGDKWQGRKQLMDALKTDEILFGVIKSEIASKRN